MKWNWVAKVPVFSRFFAAVEKFAGRAAAGHLILRRRTPGNFRQVAAGQLRSQVELLELWGRHPHAPLAMAGRAIRLPTGKKQAPLQTDRRPSAAQLSISSRGVAHGQIRFSHPASSILPCGRRGGADHVRPHRLPRGPASFRQIE